MKASLDLYHRIMAEARRLNTMNEFGALHIFVADGNCEQEHLEFCLKQADITDEEKGWLCHLMQKFSEEEIFAIYAFAQCADAAD